MQFTLPKPLVGANFTRDLGNANSRFFTDCYLGVSQFDPQFRHHATEACAFDRTIGAVIGLPWGNVRAIHGFPKQRVPLVKSSA